MWNKVRTYWLHAVMSMIRLSRCVVSFALVSRTSSVLNSPHPIFRHDASTALGALDPAPRAF